jgi:integrating conjugative element protein (TIGR03761 family)
MTKQNKTPNRDTGFAELAEQVDEQSIALTGRNPHKEQITPHSDMPQTLGKEINTFVHNDVQMEAKKDSYTIELRTKDARLLIFQEVKQEGHKRNHYVAVDTLNAKLPAIYKAAQQDDPFADQLLLDIEQAIANLSQEYSRQTKALQNNIHAVLSHYDLSVELNQASVSSRVTLNIDYDLVMRSLFLVKSADTLLYTVFLAQKCTVIDRQQAKAYQRSVKDSFRKIIRMIYNWKFSGITRLEMAYAQQRGLQARELNKAITLTSDVLLFEQRAICAPYVPTRQNDRLDDHLKAQLMKLFVEPSERNVEVVNNTTNHDAKIAYEEADYTPEDEQELTESDTSGTIINPLGDMLKAKSL